MIKYNSDNIIVGYIKQLLHDCNLPRAFAITEDTKAVFEGQIYLYKGNICRYIGQTKAVGTLSDSEFKILYYYNEKKNTYQEYVKKGDTFALSDASNKLKNANLVKNLEIKSLEYDTRTHEFLGDYLRYLRDVKKLDLMGMYNCFSDHMPKIHIDKTLNSKKYYFDSDDTSSKIYSIPVKLFKKYTIRVTTAFPVEVACVFEGENHYELSSCSDTLLQKTYQKININGLALYSKLNDLTYNDLIALNSGFEFENHLSDLRLLIKIKASTKSGIVVLEGDYRNYNDMNLNDGVNYNHTVNNYDKDVIEFTPNMNLLISSSAVVMRDVSLSDSGNWIMAYPYEEARSGVPEESEPNSLIVFKRSAGEELVYFFITDKKFDEWEEIYCFYGYETNRSLNKYGTIKLFTFDNSVIDGKYGTVKNITANLSRDYKLISKLQLLEFDCGIAFPFADRLCEYLVENAVTHLDMTADNIKRIQQKLYEQGKIELYEIDGIWKPIYRNYLYDLALIKKLNVTTSDVTGYCDKDVEKQLGA